MNNGDEAIAALARDRGPALVAYAYLLTGDLREAEDLVQEALVRTVVRSRSGTDLQAVEAYVRRSVATTYVDGRRRWRRWLDAAPRLGHEQTVPVPDTADRVTAQVAVRDALADLPPRERACIVLRYYEDLTTAQIADVLNLSTGTVKRYLFDATRRLEQTLGTLEEPETLTLEIEVSAL